MPATEGTLYLVSHTYSDGDTRVDEHVYRSREDAEIVMQAKRINFPKLTHRILRVVDDTTLELSDAVA